MESSKNDQKTVLPEILASLFQVADSNIDGKINPEEFKTIVHSLDSTESIPQVSQITSDIFTNVKLGTKK